LVTVPATEWRFWGFDPDEPTVVEYQFEVRDGPPIDVFVCERSAFEEFEAGNNFEVYGNPSGESTGAETEVEIGAGPTVLVIDNSDAGPANPPADGEGADVQVSAFLSES